MAELYDSPNPTSIAVRPITWLKLPEVADEESNQGY